MAGLDDIEASQVVEPEDSFDRLRVAPQQREDNTSVIHDVDAGQGKLDILHSLLDDGLIVLSDQLALRLLSLRGLSGQLIE